MTETDKEYKLRCLCSDIIEFIEKITNDFDKLCDCECIEGVHEDLCTTSLCRLDIDRFKHKLSDESTGIPGKKEE